MPDCQILDKQLPDLTKQQKIAADNLPLNVSTEGTKISKFQNNLRVISVGIYLGNH